MTREEIICNLENAIQSEMREPRKHHGYSTFIINRRSMAHECLKFIRESIPAFAPCGWCQEYEIRKARFCPICGRRLDVAE